MSMGKSVFEKIMWAGLVAIVITAPTQYSIEVAPKTFLSIVDPIVWALGGLWIAACLMRRKPGALSRPPAMVLLFLLAVGLSGLKADSPTKAGKEIFQLVEYFGITWILFAGHLREKEHIRKILFLFLGVAAVIILYALLQYGDLTREAFKIRGTFGNRNVLGGYLSLVLPLSFGLFLYDTHLWRRIGYAVLILGGIVITLSGGTFLALCVAMGILAAFRGQRVFLTTAAALCLTLIFVLPQLPRNHVEILHDSIAPYTAEAEGAPRYTEWQAALLMIQENPLLGVGPGHYQENIGGYYGELPNPTGPSEPDTQNLYLVLGSTLGLPGLVLFTGILLLLGVQAIKLYSGATDIFGKGLALGLTGSVIAFSINSIWHPLLVRGIGIPLVILLCMIAELEKQANGTMTNPS